MILDIPRDPDDVINRIRALESFTGWDSKTVLTIGEIKTYCVPGNAAQAKGRLAIWVHSAKARKPRILFPELVLRAMRFIAEPERRGSHQHLHPGSFAGSVTGKDSKLPGLLANDGVYLALARRLLGLPDDYQDPTTVRLHSEWEKEREARHPDIRTIEGLFREVLIAYGEVICSEDREATDHDWVDLSYRMLRRRQGSSSWKDNEEGQRADLAAALSDVRSNPGHADIRDIDIAVFAMLYANGLAWAGKISASAITTVVNRIADAAEDGALDNYLDKVSKAHDTMVDTFAKVLFPVRRGRGRK